MKLAVVVLNWNQADDAIGCVSSVESWGRSDVGIFLVDNGSDGDEAARLEAALSGVTLIRSAHNRGYAGGNNLGIAAALETGAGAVLLLNNDARIAGIAVERLERTLEEDETVGIAGPVVWCGGRLLSAGGRDIARHRRTHWTAVPEPGTVREVDYVPGTAALIRREVFETVGRLDEDFFFGGEMADLCARARRPGYRSVIVPESRAEHDIDRSREARERLHIYYVYRNRFLFARKHHASRLFWFYPFWAALGLSAACRAFLSGRPKQAGTIFLGVRDALAGRFGGQNERVL